MDLLLWAEDSEADLRAELARELPAAPVPPPHPTLLQTSLPRLPGQRLPHLAFARQWVPDARPAQAESIRAWAQELCRAVADTLPDRQPWDLHIVPHYAIRATRHIGARAWHSATRDSRSSAPSNDPQDKAAAAGQHRCELIRAAAVEWFERKRRHLLRQLRSEPAALAPETSLVQLLLTSPNAGFLSIAAAPLPFEQKHLLSPFPKGHIPPAADPSAPSRAFAKLVEAELRLGRKIARNETCVDLGASPGSWTWVAVNRGARVLAVDRSDLRPDLMRHRQVEFRPGDAFRFTPDRPVDWLLCDVIAAPERSAALLLEWLRRKWCRRFVVTIKLGDAPGQDLLASLKRDLAQLASEFFVHRLSANKKEMCAFGTVGF